MTRAFRILRILRILRRWTALNLSLALAYRAEWVLFMLANMAIPVVSLLIWRAALESGVRLPIDKEYVTTYFVLLGVVTMLTSSWGAPYIADGIRRGELSRDLIRPAPGQLNGIANNLSEKTMKLVALTPMVAILWWVFHDSVVVPLDPVRWALFLPSIVLAAILVFALDHVIGLLGFWFDDVGGLNQATGLLKDVLSGAVVPLALMPAWSQGFMELQPFRFMVSFPLEIVVGDLSGAELATGFAVQFGYVVLALAGWLAVWKAGIKAYSAVGA